MDRVRQYYSQFDEWARLDSAAGQIEFLRTMSLLKRFIPAQASVLDIGGGPGRYTIALTKAGFKSQLADLSPKLIETAREKFRSEGVSAPEPVVASATDLRQFANGSFDCVLALGPFYHLVSQGEREGAVRECLRVLRAGGIFMAAFIPRLSGVAGLLYRAAYAPQHVMKGTISRTFERGEFHNSSEQGFQQGYYMPLREARSLFAAVEEVEIVSVKGLFAGREDWAIKTKRDNLELFNEMYAIVEKTASDPSVIELSDHALFVGRKR